MRRDATFSALWLWLTDVARRSPARLTTTQRDVECFRACWFMSQSFLSSTFIALMTSNPFLFFLFGEQNISDENWNSFLFCFWVIRERQKPQWEIRNSGHYPCSADHSSEYLCFETQPNCRGEKFFSALFGIVNKLCIAFKWVGWNVAAMLISWIIFWYRAVRALHGGNLWGDGKARSRKRMLRDLLQTSMSVFWLL